MEEQPDLQATLEELQAQCYTVPEAARRKKVTRQAIYKAIADHRLQAVRVGRLCLVPKTALMEYGPLPASGGRKPRDT